MRAMVMKVGKVGLYLFLLAISFDLLYMLYVKNLIESSMHIAVKAAALQIENNDDKIAKGIFDIDLVLGEDNNIKYTKENLPLFISNSIDIDTVIINTHSLTKVNPFGDKEYSIYNPIVFSKTKFKFRGLILKKIIEYDIESGGVLENANNI